MAPSLRRPLGVLAIVAGLFVYALLCVRLFSWASALSPLAQLPIWATLGIIWVFPLKPVLFWIETGKWRR